MKAESARIGCAGWSLNAEARAQAPEEGTHLQRYAALFNCTEIDSSFYRAHQPKTYARWAASVPADFRFAVKMPKAVTHDAKLVDCQSAVEQFLAEVAHLGEKLGPVLVQLPPNLAWDAGVTDRFFSDLRRSFDGDIVCEPRHATWFAPSVEKMLAHYRVARVAADPALQPTAAEPGGWSGLIYIRLHGSPELYRSKYEPDFLDAVAKRAVAAKEAGSRSWTILDNTMLGHAFFDALDLRRRVQAHG